MTTLKPLSMLRPRAVFFDLDGTLIDSAPDLGAAANRLRLDRGLPALPHALYRPMAGAGARGMLKVAFDLSPEHPEFESLRDAFFTYYAASIGAPGHQTCAFEGVNAMLRDLEARGVLWGIVTNKACRFTDPLVAFMPELRAARVVISGDSTPHAKPHPAPLLAAYQQAALFMPDLLPEQCWYLGDDKRDIDAGKAAGMHTLAVTWGYEGEHALASWNADHVLNQPAELAQVLDVFNIWDGSGG